MEASSAQVCSSNRATAVLRPSRRSDGGPMGRHVGTGLRSGISMATANPISQVLDKTVFRCCSASERLAARCSSPSLDERRVIGTPRLLRSDQELDEPARLRRTEARWRKDRVDTTAPQLPPRENAPEPVRGDVAGDEVVRQY